MKKPGWFARYILKRYREAAADIGDMESYMYIGVPAGYQFARDRLAFYTIRMKRNGMKNKIMDGEERVKFGGYGMEPLQKQEKKYVRRKV